jgi:predicted permease
MATRSGSRMIALVDALIPVFLLIVAGWLLRRVGFPGGTFWPGLERLVYLVLFPALLVHDLANASLAGTAVADLALAILACLAAMVVLSLLAALVLRLDGPGFTSLFQGATRCNGFVALASAKALHGDAGLSAMALVIVFMVPAVNVMSVVLLALRGSGTRPGGLAVLGQIASNPLILGCLGGIALNVLGIGLHPVAARTLDVLGSAALPLGLLAVGAGLDLHRVAAARLAVLVGTVGKTLGLPLVMAGTAAAFGVDGLPRAVAILFCAMPTATSAFILARQLGGDAALVGGITTASTLAAAVSVPFILAWLG